jgi:hypothetical protein
MIVKVRIMNSKPYVAFLAVLLCVFFESSVSATDNAAAPIPEFAVDALDGRAVKSSEMPIQRQRWVLIYVVPNSRPCETLLKLINSKEYPDLPSKLVILVGRANAGKAGRVAGQFPDLHNALWYADTSRDAFTKMRLAGVPMIVGFQQNHVAWRIAGLFDGDPKKLQRILAAWCRDRRHEERGTHQSTQP